MKRSFFSRMQNQIISCTAPSHTHTQTHSKRKMEITRERSWKVAISMIQPGIMIQRFAWWPHSNLGEDYRCPRRMTPATEAASLKLWYLSQWAAAHHRPEHSPHIVDKRKEKCVAENWQAPVKTHQCRAALKCTVATLTDGRCAAMVGLINTATLAVTGSCLHQRATANMGNGELDGEIPCQQVCSVSLMGWWWKEFDRLDYGKCCWAVWNIETVIKDERLMTTFQLFAHLLQFIFMPRPKQVLQNINISVCYKVRMGRWKMSQIAKENCLNKWIVVYLHCLDSHVRR